MPRSELKMQAHICDSYKLHGGYACKWDAEHAKGKPDLVCAMPDFGGHFIEVKHRPEIKRDSLSAIKNPLERRQITEARLLIRAGATVMGGLVIGGMASVSTSSIALFDPLAEVWYLSDGHWVNWQPKMKFYIPELLIKWRTEDE